MTNDDVANFVKQFKGTCNKCGKYGHKGADCKSQQSGGTRSFSGKCYHCGKQGHRKADCRDRLKKLGDGVANLACDDEDSGDCLADDIAFVAWSDIDAHPKEAPRKRKVTIVEKVSMKTESQDGKHDYGLGQVDDFGPVCKKRRFASLAKAYDQGEGLVMRTRTGLMDIDDMENDTSQSLNNLMGEMCFMVKDGIDNGNGVCRINGRHHVSFNDKTVFADTGASCNLFENKKGAYDVEEIQHSVAGIGGKAGATWRGKKLMKITQVDGTNSYLEVYGKGGGTITTNLFGVHLEEKRGGKLGTNDDGHLTVTYPSGNKITMDRRMQTRDGWVCGVEMTPVLNRDDIVDDEIANLAKGEEYIIRSFL